jgi:hypothetical protein
MRFQVMYDISYIRVMYDISYIRWKRRLTILKRTETVPMVWLNVISTLIAVLEISYLLVAPVHDLEL